MFEVLIDLFVSAVGSAIGGVAAYCIIKKFF